MITRLIAENFQRISVVQIEPDGSPTVIIGGRNRQGKTSLLDAIEAALGGGKRIPDDPIKHGAKKARLVVETESIRVTRTFTAKGSRLEVRPREKGAVAMTSPQKILDELVGALTFDPLGFGRMKPEKQSRVLRQLAGVDLDKIDEARKGYETKRRDIGRDKKNAEGALASLPDPVAGDADAMGVSEILAEIKRREEVNDDHNSKRKLLVELRGRATALTGEGEEKGEIQKLEITIRHTEEQLAEFKAELKASFAELEKLRVDGVPLNAEVAALVDEDVAELKASLAKAEETTAAAATQAADAARRVELEGEVEKHTAAYDHLTEQIAAADANRDEAITKAKYPVPGLEAQDEGVYLDGVPWQQASQAETLEASVAIGLALNPKLKILLIRDGSCLDADAMKSIAELAAKAGAQLWIERVGAGDEVSVVIEDGEVANV